MAVLLLLPVLHGLALGWVSLLVVSVLLLLVLLLAWLVLRAGYRSGHPLEWRE
jgi:hypothetical protein